jgi:hypothetical protein
MGVENMFTKSTLAELTGLEPRQVTFLVDKGVVQSAGGGGKRGANFSFSRRDAVDACVAAELFRFGVTYKVIKSFLNEFRDGYDYGSRNISSKTGAKGAKWLVLRSGTKGFNATIMHAERPDVEQKMNKAIIACIVIDMARIEDRVETADLE